MRFFKMTLFILLFYLFFNINCYASTKTYEITNDNHNITIITDIDRDKIYEDLFKKLGGKYEVK